MGVITISRQFGSGGETISRMVSDKTGFLLVNKKKIADDLFSLGIKEHSLFSEEKPLGSIKEGNISRQEYIAVLHDYLYDSAIRENLVILGRGGHLLFEDFPPSLHVRIITPLADRIHRVMHLYSLGQEAARKLIKEQDRDRTRYFQTVFGEGWSKKERFDLVINTGRISYEDAADIIIASYRLHGESRELAPGYNPRETVEDLLFPLENRSTSFMHPSEEEFAKMLDFYQIKWEYEPKTFPLEWDSEGNITEALAPDFYLPEQDLYLELTTQKQKLVWKKNKKIRRLKELYPQVKIKIIYGKDYQGLLRKFGLEEG